jgi:hypothetical protein
VNLALGRPARTVARETNKRMHPSKEKKEKKQKKKNESPSHVMLEGAKKRAA